MDSGLKEYLENNKIKYIFHEHPSVFTVAEHEKLGVKIPGAHTKSLFLKDTKGIFYLVCMSAQKRLDIKSLQKHLQVEKLRFASPEELKEKLALTPGSVSIFVLVNDIKKETKLIIDKSLFEAKSLGFHPNINTSTLELDHSNLVKYLEALNIHYEILDL